MIVNSQRRCPKSAARNADKDKRLIRTKTLLKPTQTF